MTIRILALALFSFALGAAVFISQTRAKTSVVSQPPVFATDD
jgi:hypothetical protein